MNKDIKKKKLLQTKGEDITIGEQVSSCHKPILLKGDLEELYSYL